MPIPQIRVIEILRDYGLNYSPRKYWHRVNGTVPKRSLNFNAGDLICKFTISGYRIVHPLCESVSPAQAEERHLGRVRGWINMGYSDQQESEEVFSQAVKALVDLSAGFDVE